MIRPTATRAAQGLTLVEVIVAMVLVSIMGAMISASITQIARTHTISEKHRNALEVAHRIILSYIDDPDFALQNSRVTSLNDLHYEFEIQVDLLILPEDRFAQEGQTKQIRPRYRPLRETTADEQLSSKLQRVTVRVFAHDPQKPGASRGAALASVSRIFNPLRSNDPQRAMIRAIRMMSPQLDERQQSGN